MNEGRITKDKISRLLSNAYNEAISIQRSLEKAVERADEWVIHWVKKESEAVNIWMRKLEKKLLNKDLIPDEAEIQDCELLKELPMVKNERPKLVCGRFFYKSSPMRFSYPGLSFFIQDFFQKPIFIKSLKENQEEKQDFVPSEVFMKVLSFNPQKQFLD